MPAIRHQPSSRRPGASREAVLSAALEMFLQNGFAATRVEDIAQRAGVGKGSVYLHVRNKQELFQAVIDEGVIAHIEQAEAFAVDFSGSATELMNTLLHNNLVDFWDSPSSGIYKLIIAESQQFPELAARYYHKVTRRARKLLEDILQLGIAQGEYRAMDVPYTARIILGALDNELIQAYSLGTHADDTFDAHRFIDALLAFATRGLGTAAQPGPTSDSAGHTARGKTT
jgi:AcrR family transcriptional regulator